MKEKITEVSIQLFEKKGFSETSIQDICDALEVTKGTFYYYFNSKEELLLDIHLAYIHDILERQEKILGDESKDARTKLYDVVYMLIHSIARQGVSARVFFREMRHLSENKLAVVIPKRTQLRLNIETLLRQGVADGEFRKDLNVEIATFGVLGIANWSYQWFHPDGVLTDKEVAQIFVDMVLKGIESP
ncbi:TetR/AcrR family transcriptional regulator [Alicyclobacillaceae bacterium I2511]|nr:TetR/AcrR family transcriptional regulator [Alicyclobacillaceae bacterium I2511]